MVDFHNVVEEAKATGFILAINTIERGGRERYIKRSREIGGRDRVSERKRGQRERGDLGRPGTHRNRAPLQELSHTCHLASSQTGRQVIKISINPPITSPAPGHEEAPESGVMDVTAL